MNNEFVNRLSKIEKELLELKTATQYTLVRSMNTVTTDDVYTGYYSIQFEQSNEDIISFCYPAVPDKYCWAYIRTPSENSQVIEINTTHWDNQSQQYLIDYCPITIISNAKVLSVTRIS